jgi:hypothetical protein
VAFFIVEILGMFSGVSIFIPSANVCYIFCHFFGRGLHSSTSQLNLSRS